MLEPGLSGVNPGGYRGGYPVSCVRVLALILTFRLPLDRRSSRDLLETPLWRWCEEHLTRTWSRWWVRDGVVLQLPLYVPHEELRSRVLDDGDERLAERRSVRWRVAHEGWQLEEVAVNSHHVIVALLASRSIRLITNWVSK